MSTPDYELFPLFGYDVAGPPSGPVDPGPTMGPSTLQVNGQPAGYNLPVDYTGPLLVGSPGGGPSVVLTDQAAIDEYHHDERTRLLQGVAQVAALPLLPLISAATTFTPQGSSTPSALAWQDPQVNFPPTDRIYVPGTEPPPPNRMPVPYEPPPQPGPFAFGIGGISAIVGGIIGAMLESDIPGIGTIPFPNSLDPELGPYDTRAPSASPEVILSGPDVGDVAAGPTDIQGPPSNAGDNPPLPTFPDFGFPDPVHPEDIGAGPVPESVYGPPQGAQQSTPAPAATSAPGLPPWVWPLIGGIGALAIGRAGRSRSSMTVPEFPAFPPVDLTVINEPLLGSAPPLEQLGFGPGSFVAQMSTPFPWADAEQLGGDDHCNCSKKRGRKRKCLARAQLTWRSGPKKGRAAGSKCYRFGD